MLKTINRRILPFVAITALAATVMTLIPGSSFATQVVVHTRAAEVATDVTSSAVVRLPFNARDIALHWNGAADANVSVSFSDDGIAFGKAVDAGRDEIGEQRHNGETYGSILSAHNSAFVQLHSDRPLSHVSVLSLADGSKTLVRERKNGSSASASVAQPNIIARSGWGADESLRFSKSGAEVWPPTFWPVQKLIVHHTDTQNNDPDPAATIRSIYYYHAITQGWGDIGYNFLIDEAGHIYKGRHSHTTSTPSSASPSPDDTITGEDGAGNGVTAGHAYGYNSGTVGIAFLGTLTTQDATASAKSAMEDALAWKADAHGIDPYGNSVYTNPTNGTQTTFPNIAGHRDVNATACPGDYFYPTLPSVRTEVANRIAANAASTTTTSAVDVTPPTAPTALSATPERRSISLKWSAATDTGGSGLAGYQIYRNTSAAGSFSAVAVTADSSYTDNSLIKAKTYWYYVKAYDNAGNKSPQSNTVSSSPK